ncbi:hypothetical protein ACH5RR_032115 [Cinchona calisaya]|uniref:Uncharacterized protein n=1 Tax=Cinchona calisaya TaxID=153742 RepID=A0ABD2YMG6_9GENT
MRECDRLSVGCLAGDEGRLSCSRINFQSVCETMRSTNDRDAISVVGYLAYYVAGPLDTYKSHVLLVLLDLLLDFGLHPLFL